MSEGSFHPAFASLRVGNPMSYLSDLTFGNTSVI